MKLYSYLVILVLFCTSCAEQNKESKQTVIDANDYNVYLDTEKRVSYQNALRGLEQWSDQVKKDSSNISTLNYLSQTYSNLFSTTGNIHYLDTAVMLKDKSLAITADDFKPSAKRSRAALYIKQHKFKEAKQTLLSISKDYDSSPDGTQLMLFDAYMELGEYDKAQAVLDSVKDLNDYSYLIRAAKWNDYKGNLDNAISLLEKAQERAERQNNGSLILWSTSNLGDFYGHAGRIEDSYNSYLKTLERQNDNAYAKKGIAWIAYSHEDNPDEALRILDSINVHYNTPDYHLLKAEIYEYKGDLNKKEAQLDQYWEKVLSHPYGNMYNAYNAVLYAEEEQNFEKAIAIAEKEVENRATPETYQILAYVNHLAGNNEKALEIIENHVINKTFEPEALFRAALIYKANGMLDKAKELKEEELLDTAYELGPVTYQRIKAI